MIILRTIAQTTQQVGFLRKEGKTIGFVPTMGALHQGHIALIESARRQSDVVVCSIFVNPIQFNDPVDLQRYPRTEEADLNMLGEAGCHIVFIPAVEEIYPEPVTDTYDFGYLDKVMEGAFRPGHFNGVSVVVKRLFDIIRPDLAFFGEKDFQQLTVIRAMVIKSDLPVQIVACPTIREANGLAMSSRNLRLTQENRAIAGNIYRILTEASRMAPQATPEKITEWVYHQIQAYPEMQIEYFSLCDSETLLPVDAWQPGKPARGCIAVYIGGVRLIDNVEFGG
ncbi:MAG: pantoate--beta-alanine ligase [Bacteroidales bacterium]|nr:pantoate--beta-alanine ligase [Bacteroidales bacterium]